MQVGIKTAFAVLMLAASSASAAAETAISCNANGTKEIYIINDATKRIEFFNQKTRTVGQVCFGNCKWTHTASRIEFETDSGFVLGASLDRTKGTLTLHLAGDDYVTRRCVKAPMPLVAKNRF